MNDLAFVMCNLKLKDKQNNRSAIYDFEDIHSDDEWITEGRNQETLEINEVDDDDFIQPIQMNNEISQSMENDDGDDSNMALHINQYDAADDGGGGGIGDNVGIEDDDVDCDNGDSSDSGGRYRYDLEISTFDELS